MQIPRNRIEIEISVFCKQYYEQGKIYFGGNQRVSRGSKGVVDLYTLVSSNIYTLNLLYVQRRSELALSHFQVENHKIREGVMLFWVAGCSFYFDD